MLVLALALANPLGLAVYRILGENLYSPRNLIASSRGGLLLGYLISGSSMPVAVAATLLLARHRTGNG